MFKHKLLSAKALSVAATTACGPSSAESHNIAVDRQVLFTSAHAGE
jgi:hypothetical protein